MKTFLSRLAGLAAGVGVAIGVTLGGGLAAEEGGTPHYPIKKPIEQSWSFAGPFGHWDTGQLQRGLKVYTEVCAACHSLNLVSYRNLADLGYNEAQIKAYAAEYEVTDGPNDDGEMFDRPARPADRFVGPYANDKAAAAANNGAPPPDLSLMAKARAPERGFPTFIFDIFTMYAQNGPDYIHSLLTGYQDAPEGTSVGEGLHYNPYFIAGDALAMAAPLSDELVEYDDGTPGTVDQYSKDVSAFLMWAAEPGLAERKQRGFIVILFLLIFAGLLYFTKKKVWANVRH
jgi:ubiquinol-cytochrome c reductase cytochrome c1 subunit